MPDWKINQPAIFAGYADGVDDADKVFTEGDLVVIENISAATDVNDPTYGGLAVYRAVEVDGGFERFVDGEGNAAPTHTVYGDELMTVAEWRTAQGEVTETPVDADDKQEEAAAIAPTGKASKTAVKKAAEKKGKSTKTAAPAAAETTAAAEPEQGTLPINIEDGGELEVHHISSVAALLEETDALEAAKQLVERQNETDFTLGGVLAHIRREGIHQRLGFSGKRGFEDYILKELGIKYRKAQYLINNYEYFSALGVDEAKLALIGWSKVKEMVVAKVSAENFDETIEYAQEHTRDELVEYLRTSAEDVTDSSGAGTARRSLLKFSLFSDQAATVEAAINAAKEQAGSDDPNAALEYICAEWALMNDANGVTLDDMVGLVQRRFGVTLTVRHETADGQTDLEDAVKDAEAQEQQAG